MRAENGINFVGTHPTLTQVPPVPHDVAWGDGVAKSAKPTFFPKIAAALDDANPPAPPPIINRSY